MWAAASSEEGRVWKAAEDEGRAARVARWVREKWGVRTGRIWWEAIVRCGGKGNNTGVREWRVIGKMKDEEKRGQEGSRGVNEKGEKGETGEKGEKER